MAKAKKQAPAPVMEIKSINLSQEMSAVISEVGHESDLMVLQHALDQEGKMGRRQPILNAISVRAGSLRTHGEGSAGAGDIFDVETEMGWDSYSMSDPSKLKEHDQGAGSIAHQQLSDEQRMLGQLKVKENEHRTRDIAKLTDVAEKKTNGVFIFCWGNIHPPQKEILNKDGSIGVPYKPSKAVLVFCPACGRRNSPDHGSDGLCVHCGFSILQKLVKPMFDRFKSIMPSLDLDETPPNQRK